MSITKERKAEVIGDFRRTDGDVGSPEVQVALLTERIRNLTEHMRANPKDFASQRGLLMLVSKRKKLLRYLTQVAPEKYQEMLQRLNLRK